MLSFASNRYPLFGPMCILLRILIVLAMGTPQNTHFNQPKSLLHYDAVLVIVR